MIRIFKRKEPLPELPKRVRDRFDEHVLTEQCAIEAMRRVTEEKARSYERARFRYI